MIRICTMEIVTRMMAMRSSLKVTKKRVVATTNPLPRLHRKEEERRRRLRPRPRLLQQQLQTPKSSARSTL